jgi:hypothetical protein
MSSSREETPKIFVLCVIAVLVVLHSGQLSNV